MAKEIWYSSGNPWNTAKSNRTYQMIHASIDYISFTIVITNKFKLQSFILSIKHLIIIKSLWLHQLAAKSLKISKEIK